MPGPKDLDPSTSPRALVGAELRHARERAGLSQAELGEPLFVSGSFIGQLEMGLRRMHADYARQIDELLGTGGFFLRNCAAASKSKYPDHFAEAAEAEAVATEIREFATLLIPGVLQTRTYAYAVFRGGLPTTADDEIEELVDARLERSRLLAGTRAPVFWVVLDEAVLRRVVGGPAVMAEALRHLVELARQRRIIMQVLPFEVGAHVAQEGALKLMSFADAPQLAYLESLGSGQLQDDPAAVRHYALIYELLAASALSPAKSLALVEAVAEDYTHGDQT